MKKRALTHAKMAKPFVHAPLFRSFEKGERNKLALDITYEVRTEENTVSTFRFVGPEPLGTTDLRVLQGLVGVVTGQLFVSGGVKQLLRDGRALRARLELTGDASAERSVAARFSIYSFASALGYASPGSATLKRLREAVERLSAVTVFVAKPSFRGSYRILSGCVDDTETGEVIVGLNPQLTTAVFAPKGYLRVGFDEMRKLKGDPARLMHSRLHWLNQGASSVLRLSTLCEYVYGDTPVSASGNANRKAAVREGLVELNDLGWSVDMEGVDQYRISRPGQPAAAYVPRRR